MTVLYRLPKRELLKKELFNYLREKNISALLAFCQFLTLPLHRSPEKKGTLTVSLFAYFPRFARSRFLTRKSLHWLGDESCLQGDGDSDGLLKLHNAIIIKPWVSASERGVLLISFERELEKIVQNQDRLHKLESRYRLVFLPSWTGLFSPPLVRLAALARQPFHVMPVHAAERNLCHHLGPLCHPLPFNAASWVNSHFYEPETVARDIDCLMVANFAGFKRHWILFKALSQLPESITATCVGVPWGGRTRESLLHEAAQYGVEGRVQVVENPPQEELRRYFKRAKLFCALSYREGSFIAVAEALMSGTPVVMFRGAHIGSKELIGNDNGTLVDSVGELREAILRLHQGTNHQAIRDAASAGFSAQASCIRLNTLLRSFTLSEGGVWSRDLCAFYSMRLGYYYQETGSAEVKQLESDHQWLAGNGIQVIPH